MGLHQVGQLLQVLLAIQLQCCLRIMLKSCFRNLLIRGQIGCREKIQNIGKRKHNRVGKDVLFVFACAKQSNLGKVGQERMWGESHPAV